MSFASTVELFLDHPISKRHRLQALRRALRWQIGSRLLGAPVVFPWIGGVRFVVNRGEYGLTGNVYHGLHEFSDMAFLLHFLRKEDLFVDVGANVGSYSLLAGGVVGARAVAFEPVPATFERLVDNIRLNRLENVVDCRRAAVGAAAGSIEFTTDNNTMNRALSQGERSSSSVQVDVVELDTVLAGASPALLKVDVEGFETPVVDGARQVLATPSLRAVIMELNGSGARYGFDEERIVGVMRDLGFVPHAYEPISRRLQALDPSQRGSHNTIFIRDAKDVAARVEQAAPVEVYGVKF